MTNKILIDRELLPCPFCGGEATKTRYEHRWPRESWRIECKRCSASVDTGSEGQAVIEWNTRAALDAPQQEAVAWYCDAHGYTDNKDDAESWRSRGMPVTEYYLHSAPDVPDGWQPSDDELTNIYNTANGLDPKRHNPITTERIFTAMRAMLSAAPKAPTADDRKDAERTTRPAERAAWTIGTA